MIRAFLALALAANGGTGYHPEQPIQPATVACYGDSLMQLGGATPPPNTIASLLPGGYTVQNLGVAGETANSIVKRVIQGAATACLGRPCGTYVFQGAVNTLKEADLAEVTAAEAADIALNGNGEECSPDTAGDAPENTCGMLDGVDYVHATYPSARLLLVGALPYAGCDSLTCPVLVDPGPRARAYNAAMLAACALRPWLVCVSPYADFEDPENQDHLRMDYVYAPDGIHLVEAGAAAFGSAMHAAMRWR